MKHIAACGPLVALFLLSSAGCATTGSSITGSTPRYEPPVVEPAPLVDADGGFSYDGGSLYSARRARAVGDLVTIRVAHNTSANTSANTKLTRQGDVEAGVSALFGLKTQIAKLPEGGPSMSIGTTTKNDYTGTGGTDRAGKVSGTLTTRVVQVLGNGHLVVFGRQDVRINNETEVLAVTGIVDPRSIGTDNSVPSSAVADLRVEYAGMGVVAGKQRPGWFTRILDVVTPF